MNYTQHKSIWTTIVHKRSFQRQAKTRSQAVIPFPAVGGIMYVSIGPSGLSRVFRDIVGRGFMIASHIRSAGESRAVSV